MILSAGSEPALHISGMLTDEQGATCIGQDMEQEPLVIRQLDEQGQSLRRLFHRIVTRMSVHCVRSVYTFQLEALLMIRSFDELTAFLSCEIYEPDK